jgi:hypothetical protein
MGCISADCMDDAPDRRLYPVRAGPMSWTGSLVPDNSTLPTMRRSWLGSRQSGAPAETWRTPAFTIPTDIVVTATRDSKARAGFNDQGQLIIFMQGGVKIQSHLLPEGAESLRNRGNGTSPCRDIPRTCRGRGDFGSMVAPKAPWEWDLRRSTVHARTGSCLHLYGARYGG